MADFDLDTRVEGRDGRYGASLSKAWEIWGPNGGYLASIALRAAGAEASIARPVCISGHFLRPGRFAPVDLDVAVLQRGRRSESLRVGIRQEGRPLFEALVRTAAVGEGLEHDYVEAPPVDPPESLGEQKWDGGRHPFWQNFDSRWVQPPPSPPEGREAMPPHWISWHRLPMQAPLDDPFLEAARSLLLLDTLGWPAACMPHPDSAFIAPNLDVAVWFHAAAPASEWLLAEIRSPRGGAGLISTQGRIFSHDRRLLASGGAQLFCVPRPPEV